MGPSESRRASTPGQGVERLSPRERQVAQLVADGLKPSIIARRLGLAEATVGSYVRRIQWRLKLESRAELAAWVAGRDWARTTIA